MRAKLDFGRKILGEADDQLDVLPAESRRRFGERELGRLLDLLELMQDVASIGGTLRVIPLNL